MTIGKGSYGRVGVLSGGPSSEREISLRSGKSVYSVLAQEGVDAVLLDISKDVSSLIKGNGIDVAFIALHGRFGEDGTVQNILEELNVPYTGSGPRASRLALDKVASKEVFIKSGIKVPRYVVLDKDSFNIKNARILGFPVVVKPYLEGSSIGLSVVREEGDLPAALDKAFEYGQRVLVEEYIYGRELTVGMLNDKPLPVIEIVTRDNIYDYKAKYSDPDTRYLVPAPVDESVSRRAQDIARRSHESLGCRCFSRIDMMMDSSGALFVLEANTIPGMTERSLLPKAAQAAGLSFGKLCVTLIEDALKRFSAPSPGAEVGEKVLGG
jgi:D-alanine-D-alanine ligase